LAQSDSEVELAGPLLFVVATLPPFKSVERTVKKSLKENHSNKPFSTDHLYLAAYLICQGHQVTGTNTNGSGRIQFQFTDSPNFRSAVADFLSGGQVDARQFSFTVLRLKKYFPRRQ
jgi:hypothetical protein